MLILNDIDGTRYTPFAGEPNIESREYFIGCCNNVPIYLRFSAKRLSLYIELQRVIKNYQDESIQQGDYRFSYEIRGEDLRKYFCPDLMKVVLKDEADTIRFYFPEESFKLQIK